VLTEREHKDIENLIRANCLQSNGVTLASSTEEQSGWFRALDWGDPVDLMTEAETEAAWYAAGCPQWEGE
jgi:hypothetical protein